MKSPTCRNCRYFSRGLREPGTKEHWQDWYGTLKKTELLSDVCTLKGAPLSSFATCLMYESAAGRRAAVKSE